MRKLESLQAAASAGALGQLKAKSAEPAQLDCPELG